MKREKTIQLSLVSQLIHDQNSIICKISQIALKLAGGYGDTNDLKGDLLALNKSLLLCQRGFYEIVQGCQPEMKMVSAIISGAVLPIISGTGIELMLTAPVKEIEIPVLPGLLHRVFQNLTVNSCEALVGQKEGEIRVVINDTKEHTVIHFSDNGPGLPNELRHKAFNIGSTTKKRGGGMGLNFVQRAIQKHGGTISIGENDPGAVFIVTLPQ